MIALDMECANSTEHILAFVTFPTQKTLTPDQLAVLHFSLHSQVAELAQTILAADGAAKNKFVFLETTRDQTLPSTPAVT